MTISEFSIPFRYKTKRNSAVSWVASHALHHWYIFLVGIIGAIGNAALASVPALQYGIVFENLTSGNPLPSVFYEQVQLSEFLRSAVVSCSFYAILVSRSLPNASNGMCGMSFTSVCSERA